MKITNCKYKTSKTKYHLFKLFLSELLKDKWEFLCISQMNLTVVVRQGFSFFYWSLSNKKKSSHHDRPDWYLLEF